MNQIAICGGRPLFGEVTISGAKNAALGIVAAAILADEDVIVRNVPDVSDVTYLLDAIKDTGARVQKLDRHTYCINGSTISSYVVDNNHIRKMRAGYYMLGALLGKYHHAEVALPGGCTIGARPIDFHIKGFEALGAVAQQGSMVRLDAEELHGADIFFDTVSVGATINVMIAAVFAEGRTILENAAKEPHIVDVANFLNSMGAKIKGAGTDTIRIQGVEKLHGTDYMVIPDQIEAGTFMAAAAATRGDVLIKNVIPKHLDSISSKLREIGCMVYEYDDAVRVTAMGETLKATRVRTQPYPGFPTDMQAQMAVVLSTAQGTSRVTETIFESRFKYVAELNRMGADIKVDNFTAIIEGVEKLTGAQLIAPDLRAGAALVIAALAAEGESIIDEVHYILRGYEDFVEKFKGLGGRIEMVDSEHEAEKFFLKEKMIG